MLSFVGWLFVVKGKAIVDEDGIPVCTRHEKVRFGRGFAGEHIQKALPCTGNHSCTLPAAI